MSFDTAMWIVLVLVGVALVATVYYEERRYRRRCREIREQWQADLDRRYQ